jgi:hypothetical protein
MSTINCELLTEELIAVSKSLRTNAERAVALRSFFDLGQEPASIASVQVLSSDAAVLVRGAILEGAALAISRMLDPGGSDKHTLEKAYDLLSVPGVRERFEGEGSRLAFDRYRALVEQLRDMDARKKIKAMRDYAMAHMIPGKFKPEDRPQFDDLWRVYQIAIGAVEELGVATKTVGVAMRAVSETWNMRNRFYWNQLILGARYHPKLE